jgi:2-succinyl-5-enolpyruvyl-6-hydroxy-3-cyclohexene-1-carboxylate synthase
VSEGDVAFACTSAFVQALFQQGVTDACLSPGSRSTPLALALARHRTIRVHVHVDERSAAFFALGLAKASDKPVVVACTSGTATAEMFPAIVEASTSRTPLLVLTADRPPELRGVGANQTIDQLGMFGRFARWFVDAPVPEPGPASTESWTSLALEAYRRACEPPGPVHLNLPFREPLVPSGGPAEVGVAKMALGGIQPSRGRSPTEEELHTFVESISDVTRGVVYAGSLRNPAPAILALGGQLKWPVIGEPTSGCRLSGPLALEVGQLLLADQWFASTHVPEVVVQFGAAPTTRAAIAMVGAAGRLLIVDPDDVVADPNRHAERRFTVNAAELVRGALTALAPASESWWLDAWIGADAIAGEAVDAFLDGLNEPFEGRVARDLAHSLPDGSTLVVGSSMPVRDLDAYMRPRDGLGVLANRGASGIDGFVSTALGVAATGVPTAALCGDLTLLHDIGSLLWSARRGYDCVFVVPNNDGGAIFSFLPQRDLPELDELFTTPHGLDLSAVCSAAGAGHTLVRTAGDLIPAVERAREGGGVHVVEVPTDRERNVELHAAVHEAVAAALGA